MALDASATKVFIRGSDLSTVMQSTALEESYEETDGTAYAHPIRQVVPTLRRIQLAHAALYEDGAFTIGEVFRQAKDTDDEPVTICPEGTALDKTGFIVLAHRANISMPAETTPGEVHHASLRAASRQKLGDGLVLFNGTISSSAGTVRRQIGAPLSGSSVLATVHLIGITPAPSVVFSLNSDDSSAFLTPTGRAVSAAQTARGSVLLTAPGPITDNWWEVSWTYSGTGSFTAVVTIGLAS